MSHYIRNILIPTERAALLFSGHQILDMNVNTSSLPGLPSMFAGMFIGVFVHLSQRRFL